MTCRGSRFADGAKRNPNGEVVMKNRETDEWLIQNEKSTREFVRKWGHFVNHDKYLKPIIPGKYNIGFILYKNSHKPILIHALEPWCDTLYTDLNLDLINKYIDIEQKNTSFNLSEKILPYDNEKQNDILVEINGENFTQEDFIYIQQLTEILDDSIFLEEDMGEQFEVGNLKLTILKTNTYEKNLIICES